MLKHLKFWLLLSTYFWAAAPPAEATDKAVVKPMVLVDRRLPTSEHALAGSRQHLRPIGNSVVAVETQRSGEFGIGLGTATLVHKNSDRGLYWAAYHSIVGESGTKIRLRNPERPSLSNSARLAYAIPHLDFALLSSDLRQPSGSPVPLDPQGGKNLSFGSRVWGVGLPELATMARYEAEHRDGLIDRAIELPDCNSLDGRSQRTHILTEMTKAPQFLSAIEGARIKGSPHLEINNEFMNVTVPVMTFQIQSQHAASGTLLVDHKGRGVATHIAGNALVDNEDRIRVDAVENPYGLVVSLSHVFREMLFSFDKGLRRQADEQLVRGLLSVAANATPDG